MRRNTANFAVSATVVAANFGVVAANPDGGSAFIGAEGWGGDVTNGDSGTLVITA